jgi:diguanylate cyclase
MTIATSLQSRYPDACILIIDDSEEYTRLLTFILRKAGYKNIVCLNDPPQAVAHYHQLQPDIVLLDYNMPDVNGLMILKQLSNAYPDSYLPILMITADSDTETKVAALSNGAQDFITKPFEKLEVLARIKTVLEVSLLNKRLLSENSHLGNAVNSERLERVKVENQLAYQQFHDSLTGLPNRALFYDRLNQNIEHAKRHGDHLSVVLIHVTNTRSINNTLGHQYGDELIRQLSDRLRTELRQTDTLTYTENLHPYLARISGSYFILALPSLKTNSDTAAVAERLYHLIQNPFVINDFTLELNCHIGIVHYPEHGDQANVLLQHADAAAYHAQKQHLAFMVYNPEHNQFTMFNLTLMQELKAAIQDNTLELYLQPKVDLKTHHVYGFEALLRWNHPKYGFIPPDKFVAIAEDTGSIGLLTSWVIDTSIKLCNELLQHGHNVSVSLNITAQDLHNPEILAVIIHRLNACRLPPQRLTLEITEGSMVSDPKHALEMITAYRENELSLSIDDFGSGYSSLAYLQKLPVQELKIDKSFVMDLDRNSSNQMIVKTIIDMAHHFNLRVVAEGIENQAIYDLLVQYGCDCAQGYHISRPIPFSKVLAYLESYKPSAKAG